MKRVNGLMEKAVQSENLRLAFLKAKKGKSYSRAVLAYQFNLEANLLALREQMLTGHVEVGDYLRFKVFDPKERQICAPAFREQVLHHALMNACHAHFERVQIHDSYASRPGKGVHAALERAKGFTKQYGWYLKLDVRKFFDSVQHKVLKKQLARLFKDATLLRILFDIIDSYEAGRALGGNFELPPNSGRGLPIGNLTSQYFANHYLCELDHRIKEQLRIGAYVRYMDDLVLWHDSKAVLKAAFKAIQDYVRHKLLCELKPETLNKTGFGLPFLGYRLYPHQTKLTPLSKRRFVRKMGDLQQKHQSGEWDEATCQRHALPLVAFTRHADARGLRAALAIGAKTFQVSKTWKVY
jgi:retron-type reverse transcriptase